MELQKELHPPDCTICWVWTLNKLLHPSQQLVVSFGKRGQECLEIMLRGLDKELCVCSICYQVQACPARHTIGQ